MRMSNRNNHRSSLRLDHRTSGRITRPVRSDASSTVRRQARASHASLISVKLKDVSGYAKPVLLWCTE